MGGGGDAYLEYRTLEKKRNTEDYFVDNLDIQEEYLSNNMAPIVKYFNVLNSNIR